METQQYIDRYLATLVLPPTTTKKLFVVGLIGITGSGKTTVVQHLAKQHHLFVTTNDHIRRWLNEQGLPGDSPAQPIVEAIAVATSHYLFDHGISHIIDADLIQFLPRAKQLANDRGAEFILINVVCPENIILDRLHQRLNGTDDQNLSRAGEEIYWKRKALHTSLPLPENISMTIDTTLPLDPQIEQFGAILRKRELL